MLMSGLMAGMFAAINLEQRSHAVDRDQTQVYAAAHAGLEKLTADLAGLFVQDFSPRATQLNALTAPDHLPDLPGFEYTAPGGAAGSGYTVSWTPDADGNPLPLANTTITAGPYVGFKGLLTRYDITVTARSTKGSEVRLRRGLQTVAVPVFQFGVFSESDLTFYGGDDFDFGGRVHTNANLWLSELSGKTLLFTDRITAYGDVNRKYLSNGLDAAANGMSGAVKILSAIGNLGSARTLNYSPNEGSVTNNVGGFWTTATPPVWNANGAPDEQRLAIMDDRLELVLRRQHHQPAHRRHGASAAARLPGGDADRPDQAPRGELGRRHGQPAGLRSAVLRPDGQHPHPALRQARRHPNLPTVTATDTNLARRRLELRGRATCRASGRVRGRCDPPADCPGDRPDRQRRRPTAAPTRPPMRRFT